MDLLTWLAGLTIGAVAAWQVARGCAAADLGRLRARLQEQIGYWQDQAERANLRADQLSEQAAAWAAGCQQGRDDVLSVARALTQGRTGIAQPPEPG